MTYNTDGSLSDVNVKVAMAEAGDIIVVPSGSFTWGTGGTYVSVNKAVTLMGGGPAETTIDIAADAPTFGSGTIRLSAAATVRGLKIVQAGSAATTIFSVSTANGWRITDIVADSAATAGYFVYTTSYGLIDHCVVNGGDGSDEVIFSRGPTDSWQTPSSMGSADAVFIENCTFNVAGYVCDFNANARGVVRFCTVTGPIKVDGHGAASNTPFRGVRHMEVYGNTWTSAATFWNAIELRGGTGMVFDNVNTNTASDQHGRLRLTDYGYTGQWSNFDDTYQTPIDYPVIDQIGVGQDPKVAGSAPMYLWNNLRGAANWLISVAQIPADAITLYRTQTGNPSATYTMADLITANREYFTQTIGVAFDGSSGVGRGTKAQMLTITPTVDGVGFWVTDEGSWNTTLPENTSGQLYTWKGSSWELHYTPYAYPHPLSVDPIPARTAGRPGSSALLDA